MKLKIKDQECELVFGTAAFQILCEDLGVSREDIDLAIMTNENEVLNRLVYAALKNGALCNDTEIDFNYHVFMNWLDEQPQEVGTAIMDAFMQSKMMGVTMKDRYDEMIKTIAAENGISA